MRRRDELNEEIIYYFKERTVYLRKHYQSLPLLKAEVRQLEVEKQQIAEAYPSADWAHIKVDGGRISDPTYRAVERIQKLEERHFQCIYNLRELERARDLLKPEEKILFNSYIMEARSIAEISRRTGMGHSAIRRRLIGICEKVICRIGLFGEEDEGEEE